MLIRLGSLSAVGSSLRLPSPSKLSVDIWASTSKWVEKIFGIKSHRYIYGIESTSFANFVMNEVK